MTLTMRAAALLTLYRAKGLTIVTAESCTGGMIAASLTDIAGSSAVVERGFVTYSNDAKHESIGVDRALIEAHGAVSEAVAAAMAAGALKNSRADAAVSVTGIAGPGGGTAAKPVGLVFIGGARRGGRAPLVERHVFDGDRAAVRRAAVLAAFEVLEKLAD
jgi:nicotinamide-nucleotide amidase